MKRYFLAALVLLLTACATPGSKPEAGAATDAGATEKGVARETVDSIGKGMGVAVKDSTLVETAATPLTDLNLMRTEIPAVLVAARKMPYAEPADRSCPAVLRELQALDHALGTEREAAAAAAEPGLVEKAATAVGQTAVSTVRGAVNGVVDGVVPFRSWVRKLSGAERHYSEVAAAISAGTMRRVFLKGWGLASGCEVPVAQRR